MRVVFAVAMLAGLLVTGCAQPPAAPVAVKGRATRADGKPITRMVITFNPREDQNKKNRPSAVLDAKGQFQLDCLPGRYKVTVAPIPGQAAAAPAGGDDANAGK